MKCLPLVSHFQPHPRLGNFYTFEIYISKMQDLLSQLHKQVDLIKTSLESLTAIKLDTLENTIVDHKIFGQAPRRGETEVSYSHLTFGEANK